MACRLGALRVGVSDVGIGADVIVALANGGVAGNSGADLGEGRKRITLAKSAAVKTVKSFHNVTSRVAMSLTRWIETDDES